MIQPFEGFKTSSLLEHGYACELNYSNLNKEQVVCSVMKIEDGSTR